MLYIDDHASRPRKLARTTDAISDFPRHLPREDNTRRVLAQLRLGPEFMNAIDRWRSGQPDCPPRT
jgi:hypothetical protein